MNTQSRKIKGRVSHYKDANGNEVDGPEVLDLSDLDEPVSKSGKFDWGVFTQVVDSLATTGASVYNTIFGNRSTATQPATTSSGDKKESNTGLYIGIGAGVLLLVIVVLILALKRK